MGGWVGGWVGDLTISSARIEPEPLAQLKIIHCTASHWKSRSVLPFLKEGGVA